MLWNPSNITTVYGIEGFQRSPQLSPSMSRGVSLTDGRCIFLQSAKNYTQRHFFLWILLNQTKFVLYSHFPDWFFTANGVPLGAQINRKSEITIQIWFSLLRFRIIFLCAYTQKNKFPFSIKSIRIWSWWQFYFRIWTKWNYIWFKIERKRGSPLDSTRLLKGEVKHYQNK